MRNYNEYMNKYMTERYKRRRLEAIFLLGGVCKRCGAPDNGFHQFDHWDPKNKVATIASMWSASEERFITELSKCQLLCRECHVIKTRFDNGQLNAREVHGTLSSYRYCRCYFCITAKSQYMKEYKLRLRQRR